MKKLNLKRSLIKRVSIAKKNKTDLIKGINKRLEPEIGIMDLKDSKIYNKFELSCLN